MNARTSLGPKSVRVCSQNASPSSWVLQLLGNSAVLVIVKMVMISVCLPPLALALSKLVVVHCPVQANNMQANTQRLVMCGMILAEPIATFILDECWCHNTPASDARVAFCMSARQRVSEPVFWQYEILPPAAYSVTGSSARRVGRQPKRFQHLLLQLLAVSILGDRFSWIPN